MAKKKTEQVDLIQVIGNIMTRNVNLSKEEYSEILKQTGIEAKDLDKVNETERLARIRANYYGTSINILFTLLQRLSILEEEIESQRAVLKEMCKKFGIETSHIKTSTERVNEAAERYLNKKAKQESKLK